MFREADEAIYARRNSAVEQERAIKENELNTEIAIETKKRQIRETQMDAERAVQEKEGLLKKEALESQHRPGRPAQESGRTGGGQCQGRGGRPGLRRVEHHEGTGQR